MYVYFHWALHDPFNDIAEILLKVAINTINQTNLKGN